MMTRVFCIVVSLLISFHTLAGGSSDYKLKLSRTKYGMLLGYQQGKYTGAELGVEFQWKEVKLKKPLTIAGAINMEYHFDARVLGYKIGPWVKFGRMDFTYGVNMVAFSDFEHWRIGFQPALGFKLVGFHFLTGYNFAYGPSAFEEYNKLHVSARYFISRSRKLHVKKVEKNKKK